jgi:type VI protein secretion system component Hcp
MAFRGELKLDDIEYRIIEFTYNFHRAMDAGNGQVSSKMFGGTFTFEVEVTSDNDLWAYITTNKEIQKATVTFRKTDEDSAMKTIEMERASVVDMTEHFSAVGGQPMTLRFTITCQKMNMKGVAHENSWSRPSGTTASSGRTVFEG